MIRIPYESFLVRGTGGKALEVIYRPMIKVRAHGSTGAKEMSGLVDTGADDTLLPDAFAGILGLVLDPKDHAIITGLGGGLTVVRYGTVNLEIPGAGGGYRWSARVGFHASPKIVLGHGGFLEYFTASFNGRNRHVTLTPNGLAKVSR